MKGIDFHDRRTRRAWSLMSAVIGGSVLLALLSAGVGANINGFESADGNMMAGTGNTDWSNVAFHHTVDAASTQSDDSYVSGQKQDTECPGVYGHGNPPKDDFTDVASYFKVGAGGVPYLYGATIRYASNGTASENVELKQGTDGLCTDSDLYKRVANDKLLAFDYVSGGSVSSLKLSVLTWITVDDPEAGGNDGTCYVANDPLPCWGAVVKTPAASSFEGATNGDTITSANDPIGNAPDSDDSSLYSYERNRDLDEGQFAEFGVNLQAAGIIPAGTCYASAQSIWGSRASGSSFVSTTKDIAIEGVPYSNCGEIKIIKHTDPRGVDQSFSYTSTITDNTSFSLNDKGNSTSDNAANTKDIKNVMAGTYTVTEGADPTGFAFVSVTCTGGQSGTTTSSTTSKIATIVLGPDDIVTCTYVNKQQLGAVKITKTTSKGGGLSGAHFELCTNNGPYTAENPCAPAKTGSGDLVTSATAPVGVVCVDNLAYGDYYVTEKQAPTGYKIDDTSTTKITVDSNAKCSDATYVGEAKSYTDTPLSTIEIKFTSLGKAPNGTDPATTASIVCEKGTDIVAATTENGSADPALDDTDETFGNSTSTLTPGTYVCTVVIDP